MNLKKTIEFLLPYTCVLCGGKSDQKKDLCIGCQGDLSSIKKQCEQCALPLFGDGKVSYVCGECLHHPPPYEKTVALFAYEAPANQLITSLKFGKKLVYAQLLGELLADKLQIFYSSQPVPECIIPIPLHRDRLHERGFNQALEISRPIAKKLKIKLDFLNATRVRATEAQMNLTGAERLHNVKKAFSVCDNFSAKHVAVVDDVITTGHTMQEFCRQLRARGVERVDVWCCARTSRHPSLGLE